MVDIYYRNDSKIQALAAKFGASGPLAFVEMVCAAKDAEDAGYFSLTWAGLGAAVFVDDPKPIVELARAVGLIEVEEETEMAFVARFPEETWAKWNPKSSTERSRKHREKQKGESPEPSHGVASRPTPLHGDESRPCNALEGEGETETETDKTEEGEATPTAQVLDLLRRVFDHHGKEGTPCSAAPSEIAVAGAIRDFRSKDHVTEAREYSAWQLSCSPGERHKNLITGFRNQLKRAPDSPDARPAVMG